MFGSWLVTGWTPSRHAQAGRCNLTLLRSLTVQWALGAMYSGVLWAYSAATSYNMYNVVTQTDY